MRKLILTFFFCFVYFCLYAQTNEHLKFLGVELTGKLEVFANKFETLHPEFRLTEESDTVYSYIGKFYRFEDCKISVHSKPQYNYNVSRGAVQVDKIHLYTDEFKSLFRTLSEKYGKYDIIEKYDNDLMKLRWQSENGIIEITVLSLINVCFIEYIDWIESKDRLEKEKQEKQKEYDYL